MSPNQVRVFQALTSEWQTAAMIRKTLGINGRTVRLYLAKLASMKVAVRSEVFGGFRYRLADKPPAETIRGLKEAAEVFGLKS